MQASNDVHQALGELNDAAVRVRKWLAARSESAPLTTDDATYLARGPGKALEELASMYAELATRLEEGALELEVDTKLDQPGGHSANAAAAEASSLSAVIRQSAESARGIGDRVGQLVKER